MKKRILPIIVFAILLVASAYEQSKDRDDLALSPELTELSRILHALLPSSATETQAFIELPKGYPADRALALNRLNQYRVAAGLEPYIYDPILSVMGQAHTNYMLSNADAIDSGKLPSGHFEVASNKYYSKIGDEAARTSGIGAGDDPLSALEILMTAPFHRQQFVIPEQTRVGLGFSYDPATRHSGALFVTREPEGRTEKPKRPSRFILFPPAGFDDALTTFGFVEHPDPRPGYREGDPPTGYPIAIFLDWEDIKSFEDAQVIVKDAHSEAVPVWLSFPGKPAVASPDMNIYQGGGTASTLNFFRLNFGAVFILPKKPLAPGETYFVHATLKIAGHIETIDWSFRTRGVRLWEVRPNSDDPRHDFEFALRNASEGDTIKLAAGEYVISTWVVIDKSIRIIGEPRHTVLRYSVKNEKRCLILSTSVVLQGVDIVSDVVTKLYIYQRQGARLLLEDCKVASTSQQTPLVMCERGSSLVVESCDFSEYSCPWLAYFMDSPSNGGAPTLYIGIGNIFVGKEKQSYGAGIVQRLPHLLD